SSFGLLCSRVRRYLHSFPTRRSSDLELLELLRILEEGDDLLDLVLRLVDAGDVRERHLVLRLAEQLRAALAEAHRLAAARLELRSEEHTSELQSRENLVCRLLLEKKK